MSDMIALTGTYYLTLTKKVSWRLYHQKPTLKDFGWVNFMKVGGENVRFKYPLTPESIVLDLGGYQGDFAGEIFSRYQSKIYVFEPYVVYAAQISDRFLANPNIEVYDFGLASKNEELLINVEGESSSVFKDGNQREKIVLKEIGEILRQLNITKIDLMKINIEGSEYELLEHMIDTHLISEIDNIQVQFHDFVPNAVERMISLRKRLSETHYATYQCDFIWENWKKK